MEAPGYHLYLPNTTMKGRFIMIEEVSKVLYDVDLVTENLGNPSSWETAGIDPSAIGQRFAIVFPTPLEDPMKQAIAALGKNPDFETGKLVCVQREQLGIIFGTIIGNVNVCPFHDRVMSWEKVKEYKGPVMHDEMQNGLLVSVYGQQNTDTGFVHPAVLANMPRPWHMRADLLNAELDGIWASGRRINAGEVIWMLSE